MVLSFRAEAQDLNNLMRFGLAFSANAEKTLSVEYQATAKRQVLGWKTLDEHVEDSPTGEVSSIVGLMPAAKNRVSTSSRRHFTT